jgi:hypothetical protein
LIDIVDHQEQPLATGSVGHRQPGAVEQTGAVIVADSLDQVGRKDVGQRSHWDRLRGRMADRTRRWAVCSGRGAQRLFAETGLAHPCRAGEHDAPDSGIGVPASQAFEVGSPGGERPSGWHGTDVGRNDAD